MVMLSTCLSSRGGGVPFGICFLVPGPFLPVSTPTQACSLGVPLDRTGQGAPLGQDGVPLDRTGGNHPPPPQEIGYGADGTPHAVTHQDFLVINGIDEIGNN